MSFTFALLIYYLWALYLLSKCSFFLFFLFHFPDSRFVILASGDLLIRNTSRHDSGYYRCQTRHDLSQETVLSSIEGHFIVNDVYSGVSPRISSISPVRAALGQSAELVCVTKAWPQPTIR